MKNLFIFIGILCATSVFAYDETPRSEFFHQPAPGKIEVNPFLRYARQTVDYDTSRTASKSIRDTIWAPSLIAQYGFNHFLSAGLDLSYLFEKSYYTDANPTFNSIDTFNGFSDPALFVDATHTYVQQLFHAGLRFSDSLEASKIKIMNNGNAEGNAYSGGHVLTPYLGYEYALPYFGHVGVQARYDVIKTDRKYEYRFEDAALLPASYSYSGGKHLSGTAFIEKALDSGSIGFQYTYLTSTSTSRTSGQTGAVLQGKNAYVRHTLGIYGGFPVSSRLTLLPAFNYQTFSFSDSSVSVLYSAYKTYEASLGIRVEI